MNYDFECECIRIEDKLKIKKVASRTTPPNRKSTAGFFVNTHFMPSVNH